MYGIIYKSENKVNGKVYIGQTVMSLESRIKEHKSRAKSIKDKKYPFQRAINKYGQEKFDWSIIDEASNRLELDNKEKYWIQQYDSTNSSSGYNLTIGGSGVIFKEIPIIQYTIQGELIGQFRSIAEASKKLDLNYNTIRKCCEGQSATCKKHIFLYEQNFIDIDKLNVEVETRRKLHEEHNYNNAPKKVVGFNKKREKFHFESITQASKFSKSTSQQVKDVCEGKLSQTNGYIYFYEEDVLEENIIPHSVVLISLVFIISKMQNGKVVHQYSLKGEHIKSYESVKDIRPDYPQIDLSSIHSCCRGKSNSAGGFIWIFEESLDTGVVEAKVSKIRRR